jgi:hypothetical protein
MATSYGQIMEQGKNITYKEFNGLVANELKRYPFLITPKGAARKVRSMYNKGLTVSDVISYFLLH